MFVWSLVWTSSYIIMRNIPSPVIEISNIERYIYRWIDFYYVLKLLIDYLFPLMQNITYLSNLTIFLSVCIYFETFVRS